MRFLGYNGNGRDMVAKGWLRASHAELDVGRSSELRPVHLHRRRQLLSPKEVVEVDVEILPSSTLFEAGSRLRVEVLGHEPMGYPILEHAALVNHGAHRLHTGGSFDSYLALPFVEACAT